MEYRWNLFYANLDPVMGSEQGRTRPVLVISEEAINQILPVLNVLPVTSGKFYRNIYPNKVFLPADVCGLKKDSILLCYQIRTLDKKRLTGHIGKIHQPELQDKIIDTLCFQLGIRSKPL